MDLDRLEKRVDELWAFKERIEGMIRGDEPAPPMGRAIEDDTALRARVITAAGSDAGLPQVEHINVSSGAALERVGRLYGVHRKTQPPASYLEGGPVPRMRYPAERQEAQPSREPGPQPLPEPLAGNEGQAAFPLEPPAASPVVAATAAHEEARQLTPEPQPGN